MDVHITYGFWFLQIVEKLLIAAVADAEVAVRHSIFSALHGNRSFDDFLAQADCLSAVFAALNDEVKFYLDALICICFVGCIKFLVDASDCYRILMFGSLQFLWLGGYQKKILHMFFQHFVVILYNC